MSIDENAPKLTAAGAAIRNPLSVIAMFVLLVEVIATITLVQVAEKFHISMPLVWFIVVFPTLIALLFFGTIWFRHQFLYSPYEYRSDESFLAAMQRLKKVEARQQADDLNPERADDALSIAIVDRMLEVDDVKGAVKVARAFLKAKNASTALNILKHIEAQASKYHPKRYSVYSNLAYTQLALGQYQEALENINYAMEITAKEDIAPWHQLAAAYAHKMISASPGDDNDTKAKELIAAAKTNKIPFDRKQYGDLYPEIADQL